MSDRGRAIAPARRTPPISSHDSASSSVSRPGSTTAPCGSLAMVAISSAVAGIEPVEPAAITGPSAWRRAAPLRPRSARRAAPPARWRRARRGLPGQASRAIFRNSSVSCQYRSSSSGTSPSSRSHDTSRVVMSSIRRARSSASASAEAGLLATSGASPCPVAARCRPPISSPAAPAAGGARARRAPAAARARRRRARRSRPARRRSRPRRCRRGRRCAAGSRRSSPVTSRKRSRASRQARRVGR